MTIERALCTNKDFAVSETSAQTVAHQAPRIASERVSFGRISAGGVLICNYAAFGNDAIPHSAQIFSVQFPSAFLN